MKRIVIPALVAALLGASTVLAQHPTNQQVAKSSPQSDSAIAAIAGNWEGAVSTGHGPDLTLKLTFARLPALSVVMSVSMADQEYVDAPASELTVDGPTVSWKQGMMQTSCKVSATLVANTLKGVADCGHGEVTFVARRK